MKYKVTVDQLRREYMRHLESIYGPVQIEGCSFPPHEVLKNMAPYDYELAFKSFVQEIIYYNKQIDGTEIEIIE